MKAARPARPSRRTSRLAWTDADLVALDFETTGLDPARDAIVSFGLVPVTAGRIDLAGTVYREVAPAAPLSPRSIAIHELRPQDLAAAPAFDAVGDALRQALEGRWILAWVAEVETGFLSRALGGRVGSWRRRTIDVARLARAIDAADERDPERRWPTLSAAAARWGVPVERAHHALDDALMTAELFLVLATKLAGSGHRDIRSLRRFERAARSSG